MRTTALCLSRQRRLLQLADWPHNKIEFGQAILRLCRSLQLLWDNEDVHLLANCFEATQARMSVK
jgi:hypothetical protein